MGKESPFQPEMCLVTCTSRYLPVSHQGNIKSDSHALVIIFRTYLFHLLNITSVFAKKMFPHHTITEWCASSEDIHSIQRSCSTFLSLYLSDKLFKILKLFTCTKIYLEITFCGKTHYLERAIKTQKTFNRQEKCSPQPAGINMEICTPFMEFR